MGAAFHSVCFYLGKYGVPYPPLFFLRPSYWLQQGSKCNTQPDPIPVPGCDTEPMPEGFERKEAIRYGEQLCTV